MAVEHRNLPDNALHEPKGASSAGADRVYISNGSGSGSWGKVNANVLQGGLTTGVEAGRRVVTDGAGGFTSELTPASAYGTMNLTNNTTVKNVVAATDGTLNTFGDYTKLDIALNTSNIANMGSGTNFLTVEEEGLYLIDFWGSVKSNINSTKFALTFAKNDNVGVPREIKSTLASQNVIYNMAGSGIHSFTIGDQISLYIAADKNCDITIEDMNFRMVYLGAFV